MATPDDPTTRETKVWYPARFTRGTDIYSHRGPAEREYSVVVLNVPINNRALFHSICEGARWRACADGGANRVKDLKLNRQEEDLCHIDLICGDFDSIRPEVMDYYMKKGAEVVEDKDQCATDLMKTLAGMSKIHREKASDKIIDIALLGGLEGRADQALSQLHQLYLTSSTKPQGAGDIYLITSTSIILLLDRGLNRIHVPVGSRLFTENVGIIPLAGPATLTTNGFEWNLNDDELRFGKFISTSNHIKQDIVDVETNEPVIFTLELTR